MKWVLLAELCVGKLSWLPASIMTSPTQFWNNKNVARQSEIFRQGNVWRSGITANPLQTSKFHSHGASHLTPNAKMCILPSLKKTSFLKQIILKIWKIIITKKRYVHYRSLIFELFFSTVMNLVGVQALLHFFFHIHRSYRSLNMSPSLEDSLCAELNHCN